jgi:hypothetical protein
VKSEFGLVEEFICIDAVWTAGHWGQDPLLWPIPNSACRNFLYFSVQCFGHLTKLGVPPKLAINIERGYAYHQYL